MLLSFKKNTVDSAYFVNTVASLAEPYPFVYAASFHEKRYNMRKINSIKSQNENIIYLLSH